MCVSYTCTFCGSTIPLTKDTRKVIHLGFSPPPTMPTPQKRLNYKEVEENERRKAENMMTAHAVKCPKCKKVSIFGIGIGGDIKEVEFLIYPRSNAKQIPEYVPEQIRQDYKEACDILHISPKASATLSRRCLQGMIRNTQDVKFGNLSSEIKQLENKIPASQWSAIDALRKIGNIGAHMEKDASIIVDIEQNEANLLIKLVEFLINEWYTSKHDSEEMMAEIKRVAEEKENQRHPK